MEPLNQAQLGAHIKKVWTEGRPIVPIIGAGASADSGFPPLASVVRYIAKIVCYLEKGAFLPKELKSSLPRLPFVSEFANRPERFIDVFGWPDRFQLNADLRGWLDEETESGKEPLNKALSITLDGLARKINPGGMYQLDKILRNIKKAQDIGRKALRRRLGREFALQKLSLPDPNDILSFRYQVACDWKPLLRHVSWHRPELVDALFARFAKGRNPSTIHTMLAHLTQLLQVRSIFTFNFDPFIESALAQECVPHRIFAMEHGTELPSRSHLDEAVALIKMHGGTHNVLVDERVDYRISESYREQFLNLIGERPVLLVMGCSGNDRRLVDLVSDVLRDAPNAEAIWVYYRKPDSLPEAFNAYADGRDGQAPRFLKFVSHGLGQSLRRLFEMLTGRLPTSVAPYIAHVERPVVDPQTQSGIRSVFVHKRSVTIFLPFPRPDLKQFPRTSRNYMDAVANIPAGYTVVMIDLEEHHTLEQAVAEIIDQIRQGDSLLPPFVTSGGEPNEQMAVDAAERVYFALRRSRYALCIFGIDGFPFRPTTHHGVTSSSDDLKQYSLVLRFILELRRRVRNNNWAIGDSILVLSHEMPYSRHCVEAVASEKVSLEDAQNMLNLQLQCLGEEERIQPTGPVVAEPRTDADFFLPDAFSRALNGEPPDKVGALHVACAAICCHRRARANIGLKHLFSDLFRDGNDPGAKALKHLFPNLIELKGAEAADNANKDLHALPAWLCWTKDDALWCDRPARDWIYDFNTRFTSNNALSEPANHSRAFRQAILAAILHDQIARNYYLNQYFPSSDPFLFLEYAYHRVSTLRYLAQLQALLALKDANTIARKQWDCFKDYTMGVKDWENAFSDAIALDDSIEHVRRRCYTGLHQAWTRTESYLRRALPPDQTVAWCKNLLEYNLGVKGENPASDRLSPLFFERICLSGQTEAINELRSREARVAPMREDLIGAIKNTLFRAMYAHASYTTILAEESLFFGQPFDVRRKKELLAERKSVAAGRPDGQRDHFWFEAESECTHWELNKYVAQFWNSFSAGVMPPFSIADVNRMMQEELKKGWANVLEARLRAYYLIAELMMGQHRRESESNWQNLASPEYERLSRNLEEIAERLDDAIDEAREEAHSTDRLMGNPFLEPTADRGLFVPYRSLFQILRGRCRLLQGRLLSRWARAAHEARWQEKPKELCEKARVFLTMAYRDLAYARNGIGPENTIVLATTDLVSAEVALEGSELVFGRRYLKHATATPEVLAESNAKLQTASGYLLRCLERLMAGPRFVLVWRFFHLRQVEYHTQRIRAIIDNALVLKRSSEDGGPAEREQIFGAAVKKLTGELVRRTRAALTGIRFGLDYSPVDGANWFRDNFRQQWSRLGAISMAASLVLFEIWPQENKYRSAVTLQEAILLFWIDLNASERMWKDRGKLRSDFDELNKKMAEILTSIGERIPKKSSVEDIVSLRDFVLEKTAVRVSDAFHAYLSQ